MLKDVDGDENVLKANGPLEPDLACSSGEADDCLESSCSDRKSPMIIKAAERQSDELSIVMRGVKGEVKR